MKNISDKIKNALNNVGKGAKRAVATGLVALALPFAGYALENESTIPLVTLPELEYSGKNRVTYPPFWFYDLNGNEDLNAEEIEANKMETLLNLIKEFNEKEKETEFRYNPSFLEKVPIKKEWKYNPSFLEKVPVKTLNPTITPFFKKDLQSTNESIEKIQKTKGNPHLDLNLVSNMGFDSTTNFGGGLGVMYNFNESFGLGVRGSLSIQPENVIEEYHGNPTPFGTTYSFVESETETNLGAMLVGKVGPVTIGIGAGQERKTTEVNEEISLAGRKNLTSTLTEVITPTFAIEGGIEFDVTKNFSVGASVGYNSGRGIYGGVTSSIKINEWDSKKEEGGK